MGTKRQGADRPRPAVTRTTIDKTIATIVMTAFIWTFCGIYEIAFAASNDALTAAKNEKHTKREDGVEKKFGDTIDTIEEIIEEIGKAEIPEQRQTQKDRLRIKRAEIEEYDKEIKKTFRETEEKIKDLPEEIKKRHRAFVQHYEKNIGELKDHIRAIQKATTKTEIKETLQKTKTFLQKTRPKKKHISLDPNKLPHRTAETGKAVLEEWKAPQRPTYRLKKKADNRDRTPILLASNGTLAGILEAGSDLIARNTIELALVTATKRDLPTDADLAESPEIQFTPAIKAKAEELGKQPVKIYNWVRNNIEYIPTYGSIQGADMCLKTKQCNDIDTAGLLIALLRASGIHARYVYGTIERPIEKIMNWAGGFTDPMEALRLLASAGIPVKGMTVGGEIKYVRLEHVWVEAWVDYIPSRGSRHRRGDNWIPMDASWKQYTYTQGIDIQTAVPFDVETFMDRIQTTANINEQEGYATGIDTAYIQQTMQGYRTQIQNHIQQNHPDAAIGDILGKKEIIKKAYPFLMGTLQLRTIDVKWKSPTLPENLKHKLTFNVTKDKYDGETGTPINITKNLTELAGKKITLSYTPATQADEDVINSYLPEPHPDGTPIQPEELPDSLPAYLINLKPELRIDGQVVATGTAIGMGENETFTMTFSGPGLNANDTITNDIKAGNYLGIGLDLGRVSQERMEELKTKLETTKAKLEAEDFTNITKDDILGDLLYTTALAYHAERGVINRITAKQMGVTAVAYPSEAKFSFELTTNNAFGIPLTVSPGGLTMDADRLITLVKALDGDKEKPKQYMLATGMNSSALEHSVPEQLWSTAENPAEGISAVKALQLANNQGIPIYTINQSNIDTILPQLQVDSGTITDIKNAVNAGMIVTVSKSDITYNGWTGCGYIIIDPNTGAGAYMISGGMNGAWVYALWISGLILLFVTAAIGLSVALVLIITALAYIETVLAFLLAGSAFWIPIVQWASYECAFSILPASPPDMLAALCTLILMLASNRAR